MLFLMLATLGGDPSFSAFDSPKPIAVSAFGESSKEVPYAVLYALCEKGGSGTLYVGVPAPKDVKGIYAVLPANNREGIAVGAYDCGPNGTFAKRAAEAKSASSWSSVPGTTCRIVRLPNGQLVQVCQ